MNGQFVNPSLASSSFGRRDRIIDLEVRQVRFRKSLGKRSVHPPLILKVHHFVALILKWAEGMTLSINRSQSYLKKKLVPSAHGRDEIESGVSSSGRVECHDGLHVLEIADFSSSSDACISVQLQDQITVSRDLAKFVDF